MRRPYSTGGKNGDIIQLIKCDPPVFAKYSKDDGCFFYSKVDLWCLVKDEDGTEIQGWSCPINDGIAGDGTCESASNFIGYVRTLPTGAIIA